MDIPYYVSDNIDMQFSSCHDIKTDLDDFEDQIEKLQQRAFVKRAQIAACVATLICLCRTNYEQLNGNKHKIEIIKLYRTAYGCGLKEAKETVEQYLEPEVILR